MADLASVDTTPTSDDDVSPEPTPTKPKREMVPLEKFKELEDRYVAMESTLKALTPARQAPAAASSDVLDRLAIIAKRLNADVDQVRPWEPMFNVFFEELSRPYISALATMADRFETFEAKLDTPDYKTYEADIKAERDSRLQRGEYLAPREAYHLVRSRKLPEILETERAKAVEEARTQSHENLQAGDATATEAKAGPSAIKQPGALTKEAFERLTIDEKEKALETITF